MATATTDTNTRPDFVWGLLNTNTGRIRSTKPTRAEARAAKAATERVVRLTVDYSVRA